MITAILLAVPALAVYIIGAGWAYRANDGLGEEIPPLVILWPAYLLVHLLTKVLRRPVMFLWSNPFVALWNAVPRAQQMLANRRARKALPEARVVRHGSKQDPDYRDDGNYGGV